MTKQKPNLQDNFLGQLCREQVEINMFLTNGVRLKGVLKGYDNFTVLLSGEGKQQLVFKHAISTVVPQRRLQNLFGDAAEDDRKPV
ncbi:MAG: RNA chaperone Hfq [bacterium]|nr:RNA chaperone Hfq [bacterium]